MKTFLLKGVCPQLLRYRIEKGKVYDVSFKGGCEGNLQALSLMIEGKSIEEIISLLGEVECGSKGTSCMKELCKLLKEELTEE